MGLYGPDMNALFPSAAAPADAVTPGNLTIIRAVSMAYNGQAFDLVRQPNLLCRVTAVSITAGTPVSVLTPTSGKKWRVMGYHLSHSAAGLLIFRYGGSTTEFMRTGSMAANAGSFMPSLGKGIQPAALAANDQLYLDASASGTANGYILYGEE